MTPLYTLYPSWISPEIIPGLPFRWYGMMYLVAFGITYLLFQRQVRREKLGWSPEISFAQLVDDMTAADLAEAEAEQRAGRSETIRPLGAHA